MPMEACQSSQRQYPRKSIGLEVLTVLTEKTAMTLSHSVASLGLKPSSFDKPRARASTRSRISKHEYVFPVNPQVKGSFE